jgi:hypothetical protein
MRPGACLYGTAAVLRAGAWLAAPLCSPRQEDKAGGAAQMRTWAFRIKGEDKVLAFMSALETSKAQHSSQQQVRLLAVRLAGHTAVPCSPQHSSPQLVSGWRAGLCRETRVADRMRPGWDCR